MKINWKKQAGDQSLHIAVGMVTVWILVGILPVWPSAFVVLTAWGFWEARQKKSSRYWDPYVDWAFQVTGVLLGVLVS